MYNHRDVPLIEAVKGDVGDAICTLLHTISVDAFRINNCLKFHVVISVDGVGKKGVAIISMQLFPCTKQYIFEMPSKYLSTRSRVIPLTMTTLHDSSSGPYLRAVLEELSLFHNRWIKVSRDGNVLRAMLLVDETILVQDRAAQKASTGEHGTDREAFQVRGNRLMSVIM